MRRRGSVTRSRWRGGWVAGSGVGAAKRDAHDGLFRGAPSARAEPGGHIGPGLKEEGFVEGQNASCRLSLCR